MRRPTIRMILKVFVGCYIVGLLYLINKIPGLNIQALKDNVGIRSVKEKGIFPLELNTTRQRLDELAAAARECAQDKVKIKVKQNNIIGPGENGANIKFPESINRTKVLSYYNKKHGFNTFMSDLIGVHRSLGDCRPRACKVKKYPEDLPPASVVIIFRDEYPSIVLRTAYSILETTTPHLLKDVVLVDDGSIDEELKIAVDIHVAGVTKFHLVRNKEPLGLMMARQRGIEASLADYFIVMDSHMEVCEGWMEPIVYRLVQEPKALLTPQVGGFNKDTFQLEIGETFDRSFMFLSQITMGQTWTEHTDEFIRMRNGSIEPIVFPVMQGMILAMKKDFFLQLGGFDPGMRVWGTEQMELSIKVWLCGGRVELLPCSRVAHMFRVTQWGGTINKVNHIAMNRNRFVSVWLEGEHKDIVLELQKTKGGTPSNVDDRMAIKEQNKCKPYQYFLDQVKQFSNIYEMKNTLAYGTIYNNMTGRCWDNIVDRDTKHEQIGLYHCHATDNQFFILTEKCQIRFEQHIIYVKPNSTDLVSRRTLLEWNEPRSIFLYRNDNTIVHSVSGFCVTSAPKSLQLNTCTASADQLWIWKRLRTSDCLDLK